MSRALTYTPPQNGVDLMTEILTPDALVSLLTLSLMEIVLGIDNIVFISILVAKLPAARRETARKLGLLLALGMRLGLLGAIGWVMSLTAPLFTFAGQSFTGQKLILLVGGVFLIAKATHEIYDKLEGTHGDGESAAGTASFGSVLAQILALDLVFSLDSVITAVGMAKQFWVMATAMVIAVGVMLVFAASVGNFVNRHPSMKILALSFLLLIGVLLTAEGFGQHVNKGYIYAAMAFSLLVELLNMRFRKKQVPVQLHGRADVQLPTS